MMNKINFDYIERLEGENYVICLSSKEIKELKYGKLFIYDAIKNTVKCESLDDKAILIAIAISGVDILDMFESAVIAYNDNAETERMTVGFHECINI